MQGTNVAGLELPISQLALGTMTFGDTVPEEVAAGMLSAALDAGITVVDTANGYAGGATEEMLAKLLPGKRDAVILASKAGMPHPDAESTPRCRRKGSGAPSRAASGGWRRTGWTFSTSTSRTGRPRWKRRSPSSGS